MATDDIFVQKLGDRLGIGVSKRACFNPFGEVVNSYNDVTFSSESLGEGSYHIDSYLIEWCGVLADGFEGCFSFLALSLLASLACANILNNVSFHSWPIEVLGCSVVSVVLALMASEMVIMDFE